MRWFCLWVVSICTPLWALGAGNVLIVANDKSTGSVEIAEMYAKARGIKAERILTLKTSDAEEIDRDTFNREIWEPVKKAVLADESIRIIVPTRGVPLKVKQHGKGEKDGAFKGRDFGSVDGELALIRSGDYDIDSAIENPVFNREEPLTDKDDILIVSRLDGPTVEIAKGLIEKALVAEALGCQGESFLDTRGLTKDDGYKERDQIMMQIEPVWKRLGLPYKHDTEGGVVDLSTREDTLHYYGWYAGTQKPAGTVKFRTGGVCIHLHSFSASTVRGTGNWVGPLLSWNATCSYGTVYEPYTVGFPYENIFWDRLSKGWSFGQAGQISNRLLSWQAVFCGDPLYTPYPQGWRDTHAANRSTLAGALTSGETPVGLLAPVYGALRARQDAINEALRKDPLLALAAFEQLRFLVREMGLEKWLEALAQPFETSLKDRFEAMKAAHKLDLTDTAEFEAALDGWKGLPIHAQLVQYKTELADQQEKAAQKLLKKAQTDHKGKKWLKAWLQASEAAAHKFAASAPEARSIMDAIKGDKAAMDKCAAESEKELKGSVEKAQKELERGKPDRAEKALGAEWRWHPDGEQRKAAEKLAGEIKAALSKG
ncbi:MAG: TIGR03790 family protein [Planctomycetes bacterium]|nr:TIGR03790 family protein [Planctomycetota bacterium]MCW8134166.1 TIGR03790 family protein [Planctomycetota bacterium]